MEKSLPKYSDDGPFTDPVVRCDSCNKLILVETVTKIGKCPHCGRPKFWKVRTFSPQEKAWMLDMDVDPDFLKLFEAIDGVRT